MRATILCRNAYVYLYCSPGVDLYGIYVNDDRRDERDPSCKLNTVTCDFIHILPSQFFSLVLDSLKPKVPTGIAGSVSIN